MRESWRGGGMGGGSSGDLPQRHAVNQSDLGRTGTHLVTAAANTATAARRKAGRDLHLIGGQGRARRRIDASGMRRWRWVATGRGMAAVGKTTINGVMWAELKQKRKGGIGSFLSEGRDTNVMLAGGNILSGIDETGRLIDRGRILGGSPRDDGPGAGVRTRLTAREEDEARISYLHSLIWMRCRS